MKCPNCQTENPEYFATCKNCRCLLKGGAASEKVVAEPQTVWKAPPLKEFKAECKGCGNLQFYEHKTGYWMFRDKVNYFIGGAFGQFVVIIIAILFLFSWPAALLLLFFWLLFAIAKKPKTNMMFDKKCPKCGSAAVSVSEVIHSV